MLLELEVKNFALIDHVHLQFEKGLNIMTGETGAGKSILIDAVNMAIGERADREFLRTGAQKATLQAVFTMENHSRLASIFEAYGIEQDPDQIIVVTREIYQNGRSTCRVNGTIVTQTVLKTITQQLIDIHGQHQHQSLLDPMAHVDLLDAYGGTEIAQLLETLGDLYQQLTQLKGRLKAICHNEMERERKIDLLKFQIQEIQGAGLTLGEEERLQQEKNLLVNSERIFRAVGDSYTILHEGGAQPALLDALYQITGNFQQVKDFDPRLGYFHETLEELQYRLEDITREIRDYRSGIEFDPQMLEEIEQRLDLINTLKRKYGRSIEEILSYLEQITQELELIENSEKEILKLKEEIKKVRGVMEEKSLMLRERRLEIAKTLEASLTEILQGLNMGKVTFQVNFTPLLNKEGQIRFTPKGIDHVEFMISTNLGEPLKPLAKIASGGEMSRIMLALKKILAQVDQVPTLIFDEIDTGISGKTAQVVGEHMVDIANQHQVICITHLPQIAALADCHFLIEKEEVGDATRTKVNKLSKSDRIQEVGRLLGGAITEITLQHAEEIITAGERYKARA